MIEKNQIKWMKRIFIGFIIIQFIFICILAKRCIEIEIDRKKVEKLYYEGLKPIE